MLLSRFYPTLSPVRVRVCLADLAGPIYHAILNGRDCLQWSRQILRRVEDFAYCGNSFFKTLEIPGYRPGFLLVIFKNQAISSHRLISLVLCSTSDTRP